MSTPSIKLNQVLCFDALYQTPHLKTWPLLVCVSWDDSNSNKQLGSLTSCPHERKLFLQRGRIKNIKSKHSKTMEGIQSAGKIPAIANTVHKSKAVTVRARTHYWTLEAAHFLELQNKACSRHFRLSQGQISVRMSFFHTFVFSLSASSLSSFTSSVQPSYCLFLRLPFRSSAIQSIPLPSL